MTNKYKAAVLAVGGWFLLHLRRAFTWNLSAIPVTDQERAQLAAVGMGDETLQRLAAWRRSVLVVLVGPMLLTAILGTVDVVQNTWEGMSSLGVALLVLEPTVLYLLPVTAFVSARYWTALRRSQQVLVAGWVATFLFPMVLAFCPFAWLIRLEGTPEEIEMQQRLLMPLMEMAYGFATFSILMPKILSLLPGLLRACVRIKALLPASVVPGWFLLAAAPLHLLIGLVVFTLIHHFAGNLLLILAVALLLGSPLLYVVYMDAFIRPLTTADDYRVLRRVQRGIRLAGVAAVALLLVYLATKTIYGVPLLGFQEHTSLAWMLQHGQGLELAAEEFDGRLPFTSIMWLGETMLYRLPLEYLARSLFMTVVFADTLVWLNLSIWRHARAFSQTDAAADYERQMAEMNRAIGEIGPSTAGSD